MASEEIRSFIETVLPVEAERRVVLAALAESIGEAHRLHPNGWGTTARTDRDVVRLNVGPIEVFTIEQGEPVRVIVDGGALLDPLPSGASLLPAGEYEAVKEAQAVEVEPARFAAAWPVIRKAHFALIQLAGERRKGYVWKDSHSPGVIDYLRGFLGRLVPDPGYWAPAEEPAEPTVSTEARVLDRLTERYRSLLLDGKLLSPEKADECYARFAARFGPAALKELDGVRLLQHMHDNGRDSLVYWLEFKDDEELPFFFGSISGGNALKFSVYRRKETGGWVSGSNQNPQPITEAEAINLARRNRDELTAAVEVVSTWPGSTDDAGYAALQAKLFAVAPNIANTAWGHKYLHMMCPDRIDPFHVAEYQRYHLLRLLQTPPADEGRYAAGGRYVALAAKLKWRLVNLGLVLNAEHGRPYRYWKIGTHDGTTPRKYWPMMREKGVVAIGWPDLDDLTELSHDTASRDEIKKRLDRQYPNTPQATGRSAQQIFNFVTTITEGHLVLACDGATVLGIGRVTGPYRFVPGADFPHQRPVKWLDTSEWKMPEPEGILTTVHEVRKYAANRIAVEKRLISGGPVVIAAPPPPGTDESFKKPPEKGSAPVATIAKRLPPLEGTPPEILQIQQILERKSQVILYGPPGTGKTHWAEQAARELASWWNFGRAFEALDEAEKKRVIGPGGPALVRMCCFHPSYGYEDFIEGHRPESTGGALSFQLRKGIFKAVCRDAADDPDRRYYLIVDEINRGDIPRIFGELLTLLEHSRRGRSSLVLPLSGEPFTVPPNVYVIGTMNTADRSIALIDVALRRRFGFVELMPQPEKLEGGHFDGIPLGPWLRALNDGIRRELGRDARNLQIGHSYFLQNGKPLTDVAQIRRVLLEDIVPLLEEYCYDDWSKLEKIAGKLVEGKAQRVRRELFEDANHDQLVLALLAFDSSLGQSAELMKQKPAPVEPEPDDDEEEPDQPPAVVAR